MRTPPLPVPTLPPPWAGEVLVRSPTTIVLAARHHDGHTARLRIQRCATTRLRDAYPVAAHDISVRVIDHDRPAVPVDLLTAATTAVLAADPNCRRIVIPLPVTATRDIAAARGTGLRPIVEVDLPDEHLVLFVAEPDWVRAGDLDSDHVPGT